MTNTRRIADMVETFPLLPKELFPPRLENSEEDLNRLVWEKTHRLYGENPPKLIVDRLNVELGEMCIRDRWQSAYAEFYFTDVLWPDFDKAELDRAIAAYHQRDRRFGGVKK